jgi:hypothetical protein
MPKASGQGVEMGPPHPWPRGYWQFGLARSAEGEQNRDEAHACGAGGLTRELYGVIVQIMRGEVGDGLGEVGDGLGG